MVLSKVRAEFKMVQVCPYQQPEGADEKEEPEYDESNDIEDRSFMINDRRTWFSQVPRFFEFVEIFNSSKIYIFPDF